MISFQVTYIYEEVSVMVNNPPLFVGRIEFLDWLIIFQCVHGYEKGWKIIIILIIKLSNEKPVFLNPARISNFSGDKTNWAKWVHI